MRDCCLRLLSSSAEQLLMRLHCCALSSVHQCAVCTVLLMRVHCALCCVDCCAPLCTVLLMRLHCAADKGARRPLDEKVAKNFYKSPHLRNTSKQPTMKKIYKRYITMSKFSHINWILLIKQRCPGAWVWTWRCP